MPLNDNDLSLLIDAEDYWEPVIEPASSKEIAMIDERMKDYERYPVNFVP